MSTSPPQPQPQDQGAGADDDDEEIVCERDGCTETGRQFEFFNGEYCGSDCYHAAEGAEVLAEIVADHRICASCFAVIRDIVTPPEEWVASKASRVRAALDDGAEYVAAPNGEPVLDCTDCDTPSRPVSSDAVIGFQNATDNTLLVTDIEPRDGERQWRARRRGRWGCRCGNIDHRDRVKVLERVERERVVLNLLYVLLVYYHEDRIESRPHRNRLFDTLREHGRQWDLAIGRALNP